MCAVKTSAKKRSSSAVSPAAARSRSPALQLSSDDDTTAVKAVKKSTARRRMPAAKVQPAVARTAANGVAKSPLAVAILPKPVNRGATSAAGLLSSMIFILPCHLLLVSTVSLESYSDVVLEAIAVPRGSFSCCLGLEFSASALKRLLLGFASK